MPYALCLMYRNSYDSNWLPTLSHTYECTIVDSQWLCNINATRRLEKIVREAEIFFQKKEEEEVYHIKTNARKHISNVLVTWQRTIVPTQSTIFSEHIISVIGMTWWQSLQSFFTKTKSSHGKWKASVTFKGPLIPHIRSKSI